jgi:hypothetical protein
MASAAARVTYVAARVGFEGSKQGSRLRAYWQHYGGMSRAVRAPHPAWVKESFGQPIRRLAVSHWGKEEFAKAGGLGAKLALSDKAWDASVDAISSRFNRRGGRLKYTEYKYKGSALPNASRFEAIRKLPTPTQKWRPAIRLLASFASARLRRLRTRNRRSRRLGSHLAARTLAQPTRRLASRPERARP